MKRFRIGSAFVWRHGAAGEMFESSRSALMYGNSTTLPLIWVMLFSVSLHSTLLGAKTKLENPTHVGLTSSSGRATLFVYQDIATTPLSFATSVAIIGSAEGGAVNLTCLGGNSAEACFTLVPSQAGGIQFELQNLVLTRRSVEAPGGNSSVAPGPTPPQRCLHAKGAVEVFVRGTTIQGFGSLTATNKGGCLYVSGGTLNVERSTLTQCQAREGGAIGLDDAVMVLQHSTVTASTAIIGGGAVAAASSSLLVQHGSFTLNRVGGGVDSKYRVPLGGAIALFASSVTIAFTSFQNNGDAAAPWPMAANLSDRGCSATKGMPLPLSVYGGAIQASSSQVEVASSLFHGNVALKGGGLHHEEGELTLSGCSFTGNVAEDSGGALLVTAAEHMNVSEALVVGNSVLFGSGGGALLQSPTGPARLMSSQFIDNG